MHVAGRGRGIKVSTRTMDLISYGTVELNLSGVEQLAEKSQTRAIAFALQLIASQLATKRLRTVSQLLKHIDKEIDKQVSHFQDNYLCLLCCLSDSKKTGKDSPGLKLLLQYPGAGCAGTSAQSL